MASIDERVAQIEVKVDTFRNDVARLEGAIAEFRAELRGMITALGEHMERRFEAVDRRFESIDSRFDSVAGRFDRTIGLQFAILIVIITGLFGVLTKLG